MTQIPVAPIEAAASTSHPVRAVPVQALARLAQRSPRNEPTHDITKASPGVSRPYENSYACTMQSPWKPSRLERLVLSTSRLPCPHLAPRSRPPIVRFSPPGTTGHRIDRVGGVRSSGSEAVWSFPV